MRVHHPTARTSPDAQRIRAPRLNADSFTVEPHDQRRAILRECLGHRRLPFSKKPAIDDEFGSGYE